MTNVAIVQALVLKPGDKVLLAPQDDLLITKENVQQIMEQLRDRFPGVDFTLLADFTLIKYEE